MRRVLAILVLAAAATVGFAQPAAAHTDAQANAVCDWFEVLEWGVPNDKYQLRNTAVHLWGSHQASCVYDDPDGWYGGYDHVCLLYDFISGAYAWYVDCLN